MAKVSQPAGSNAARGKLGGIIFNQHRGSNVVKCGRAPVRSNSVKQIKSNSLFTSCSRHWKKLTAAQRSSWDTFAASHSFYDWRGELIKSSGYNAFVSHSFIASNCTKVFSAITTPPSSFVPKYFNPIWTLSDEELSFETINSGNPFTSCEIRYRLNCSAGRKYSLKECNNSQIARWFTPLSFLICLPSELSNIILYFRTIKRTTGQAGPWYYTEYLP